MSKQTLNIHLIVIDGQNDFCDIPDATLPVPGASADMSRIAKLIARVGHKLADIHCTQDSHRLIDVAHPAFWQDQNGDEPKPFTIISVNDVEHSIWTPRRPFLRARALAYVRALAATGKYALCIWPPHCLIGTWGHNMHDDLNDALQEWSRKEFAMVDYITKGSNPYTEHYGALAAEVPDPEDPGTSLNTQFLTTLSTADIIGFGGEASSHCVKETLYQIAKNIGAEHLKKFVLLTDCMSPVPAIPNVVDFPKIALDMIADMKNTYGMSTSTAADFLR